MAIALVAPRRALQESGQAGLYHALQMHHTGTRCGAHCLRLDRESRRPSCCCCAETDDRVVVRGGRSAYCSFTHTEAWGGWEGCQGSSLSGIAALLWRDNKQNLSPHQLQLCCSRGCLPLVSPLRSQKCRRRAVRCLWLVRSRSQVRLQLVRVGRRCCPTLPAPPRCSRCSQPWHFEAARCQRRASKLHRRP